MVLLIKHMQISNNNINLLYWQHMKALEEIEELRKQNAELKKQNVILVCSKKVPKEEEDPL